MNSKEENSIRQQEIHDLIFSKELGWKEIIYDLINTEQLNPWDVNLTILTEGYLKKIQELEEADFIVSSKVLLAASLLLRIKSEFLLNKYIQSIDEILFGKKESQTSQLQRIELDDEIPELTPRSPIPRFKKVTLNELLESLNKAITTENRRIKKEIINKNALRESSISLPKRKFSIKQKLNQIYQRLTGHFDKNTHHKKITFSDFVGTDKQERILCFYPLLQLENQKKIWLSQPQHFQEIDIWLKHIYLKHNPDPIQELKKELETEIRELDKKTRKTKQEFENPLGEL